MVRIWIASFLLLFAGCKEDGAKAPESSACAASGLIGKWAGAPGPLYGDDKETFYFAENCTGYFKIESASNSALNCDTLFSFKDNGDNTAKLTVPDSSCTPYGWPTSGPISFSFGTDGMGNYLEYNSGRYYK